jgi:hypothetical protein
MSRLDETLENRLHEQVTGLMARTGTPGVAVGILHEGKPAAFGYGVISSGCIDQC